MSALDELRSFEARIVTRLDELAPLITEYEELRDTATRLGLPVPAIMPHPDPARPGAARVRARPGGTRAAGAERRDRVIALIAERPGITVAELSRTLGLDPPPVYRVVRRLLADAVIAKDGTRLAVIETPASS